MAPNPTASRPTKQGRTKRDVHAHVHVIGVRGARTIGCTVPKGTPVAMHGGAWYVAELDWLERCEEEQLVAAGRPPGQGRATQTYH